MSESEKIGSGAAKSFEKLEPESGTRYNDSGAPYRMEQDLLSDAEYKRNGYEYTTDHLGRLFTAEGDLRLKEHDGRLQIKDNIHDIGKGYEKSTDDRGHAIADRFDGANDLENLVPQDAGLNRNEFKNFESKLAQELEAGKQVYLKLEMHYPGDSFRPDAITAETTIDGRQEVNRSTALSSYYNFGRLHLQYKYHFMERRVLVLWWTTLTSENASVPAAFQKA